MTGGRSVFEDRGGKALQPQDRSPNEREAHQPAAPTHARIGGRANERHRSRAAARALLPSLRRPYGDYRHLRCRLPATPPANHASGATQDRYLMSVDTSRTTALSALVIDRRRAARPNASPALHFGWRAVPKHTASTAHSSPATRSGAHNHNILAP